MVKKQQQIPYFVIQQGPQRQKAFPLTKNLITIGRAKDNDIVIADGGVSRYHARLHWRGDHWVLEDLGSSNGTFVDGRRINGPVVLGPGGQVGLGPDVVLGMQVGAPGGTAVLAAEEAPQMAAHYWHRRGSVDRHPRLGRRSLVGV